MGKKEKSGFAVFKKAFNDLTCNISDTIKEVADFFSSLKNQQQHNTKENKKQKEKKLLKNWRRLRKNFEEANGSPEPNRSRQADNSKDDDSQATPVTTNTSSPNLSSQVDYPWPEESQANVKKLNDNKEITQRTNSDFNANNTPPLKTEQPSSKPKSNKPTASNGSMSSGSSDSKDLYPTFEELGQLSLSKSSSISSSSSIRSDSNNVIIVIDSDISESESASFSSSNDSSVVKAPNKEQGDQIFQDITNKEALRPKKAKTNISRVTPSQRSAIFNSINMEQASQNVYEDLVNQDAQDALKSKLPKNKEPRESGTNKQGNSWVKYTDQQTKKSGQIFEI